MNRCSIARAVSITSSSRLARRWQRHHVVRVRGRSAERVSCSGPRGVLAAAALGALGSWAEPGSAPGSPLSWPSGWARGRCRGPAGGLDLELLALVDPAGLGDDAARLDYVAVCDRVAAHAAWLAARALVAVAGERPSGSLRAEQGLEHEVAISWGISTYAAGRAIEAARLLAGPFGGFAAALRVGDVSEAHVNVLVEGPATWSTRGCWSRSRSGCCPRPGARPRGRSASGSRAVSDLDPDAATRHRRAKSRRRVWTTPPRRTGWGSSA